MAEMCKKRSKIHFFGQNMRLRNKSKTSLAQLKNGFEAWRMLIIPDRRMLMVLDWRL